MALGPLSRRQHPRCDLHSGSMSFPPPVLTRQRFTIASRSSKVRVVASAAGTPSVSGATLVHNPDGSVTVQPLPRGNAEIVLTCQPSSDISVGTASGRVELIGNLGQVSVVTASGRVDVDRAASLDVRTSSAAVHIGRCERDCRVATKSGSARVTAAGTVDISTFSGKIIVDSVGDAVVRTVSGSVSIVSKRGARSQIRTMSGSVEISLPIGAAPETTLRSTSGTIRCDVPAGSDGGLDVKTASGAIRIAIR